MTPSAPLPRWWQIEDAQVSIGGHAPDRAALATLVLIDLIVNHSDDWFTFSLPARAGQIITLDDVSVIDSFGQRWPLSAPPSWSLFGTTGLDPNSIVLWATARTPLAGPVLDDVVIGIDEDANLIWAVEQVVAGRTLETPAPPLEPPATQTDPGTQPRFSYLPMTPTPRYWHPYVIPEDQGNGPRRFVQGRAADLSGPTPTLLPAPISDLLADPHAPLAVPSTSLSRPRSPQMGCACNAGPCSPAPPPASQCSGHNDAATYYSAHQPSRCASTSSSRSHPHHPPDHSHEATNHAAQAARASCPPGRRNWLICMATSVPPPCPSAAPRRRSAVHRCGSTIPAITLRNGYRVVWLVVRGQIAASSLQQLREMTDR